MIEIVFKIFWVNFSNIITHNRISEMFGNNDSNKAQEHMIPRMNSVNLDYKEGNLTANPSRSSNI
ncbi:hypothetical protein RhiirA1_450214 [Rhizophagus irregularis]|uniref:Uncharacterized protein n=1 Tax=Rhizophagus irregularis TaxID=588596 RepID=A0A2N0QSA3_9GLOM|nr:hypothetical protein RhiirA1_478257 [Rhizophagus irregularis]PKC74241.1 hypothetical protein RhiirA1_450214 [Rhizophagus irregularis]